MKEFASKFFTDHEFREAVKKDPVKAVKDSGIDHTETDLENLKKVDFNEVENTPIKDVHAKFGDKLGAGYC